MTSKNKTERSRATSPGILAAFQELDEASINEPLPQNAIRGLERIADENDRKPPHDVLMSIPVHVTVRPTSRY